MPKKRYKGMSTFSSKSLSAYSSGSSPTKSVENMLNQNKDVKPPSGKVGDGSLPPPTTPSSSPRPVGSVPKTPAGVPAPTISAENRPASGPNANASVQGQSHGRSFNQSVNRGGGSGGGGGVGNKNSNKPDFDPNETPAERAKKRKQYKGQNRDMFLNRFSNSSSSRSDGLASLLDLLGEDDPKNKRNKFRGSLKSFGNKQNTLLGKYVGE